MKKIYDAPEFELIKIMVSSELMKASAEGDPDQIVDDGGGGPVE